MRSRNVNDSRCRTRTPDTGRCVTTGTRTVTGARGPARGATPADRPVIRTGSVGRRRTGSVGRAGPPVGQHRPGLTEQLRQHLGNFTAAFNVGWKLKTLKSLTFYKTIFKA